jgi:hypothetical protein
VACGIRRDLASRHRRRGRGLVGTLSNYFPAKSDLLFAGIDELDADFAATIESRPANESAIEAALRWHAMMAERGRELGAESPELAWFFQRRRILERNPSLAALEAAQWRTANEALTRGIAADLGDDERDLRPRLISATKVALYVSFIRHVAEGETFDGDASLAHEYVGECLRAAAAAIAAVPLPGTAGARLKRPRG